MDLDLSPEQQDFVRVVRSSPRGHARLALGTEIGEGTSEVMRMIISRELCLPAEVGEFSR